jgi:hypothetical protein
MAGIRDTFRQIKHAWNAFLNQDFRERSESVGSVSYVNPSRPQQRWSNERSIISSIYTRLSIDVAAMLIRHVRVDEDERYLEDISSGLNECLKTEPNKDQGPSQFRQDIALTLFDKGSAAIVPVDTTLNPNLTGGFDILSLRVGDIAGWSPDKIQVNLYNENKGLREVVPLDKRFVAIVENPLYDVMNKPNSTLQRLIRKLNLLDAIDEQSGSGRLDIIIQLPYTVRSESKRTQADQRRKDIEFQLKGSQYGIAWADATEKITQLNRPAENNLLKQIEYLVEMLYGQLGLTPDIMNGTADEAAMVNYHNRTIEPIVRAIVEAMKRSFLTKTARSQGQSIMAFRDPFKYATLSQIADIADKFSRNLISTPNDIRTSIGWKPKKDPKADELKNNNMPDPTPVEPKPNGEVIRTTATVQRRQLSSTPSEPTTSQQN